MSTRARVGIAVVVASLSAVGIGVVVAGWVSGHGNARLPIGLRSTPGGAPFTGYREVRIARGHRCVRAVVAETNLQRAQGLRGASDLGPYAGMLFVMGGDSNVAFTMEGVSDALDIAWYSVDGTRLDTARMHPCPPTAGCPVYAAKQRYRYALEVPAGAAAPGRLVPCST